MPRGWCPTTAICRPAKPVDPNGGAQGLSLDQPLDRALAAANTPHIQPTKTALSQNFEGVPLDDHRRWQAEIRMLTRSAALGGLAVLSLVAVATIAIIISATRSAMAPNPDIIEVLHFVRANERFI